jgi:hypothetical protein
MALFLTTFFIMTLAVGGMAIGVMLGRAPIAGSCGGLNAVDGSGACQSCSRPCRSRKKAMARSRAGAGEQTAKASPMPLLNASKSSKGER